MLDSKLLFGGFEDSAKEFKSLRYIHLYKVIICKYLTYTIYVYIYVIGIGIVYIFYIDFIKNNIILYAFRCTRIYS